MSEPHPNRLTFLCKAARPSYGVYECSCGEFDEFLINNVRRGNTKSCGCLNRELTALRNREGKANRKHGLYQTAEYRAWQNAKCRCEWPKHSLWHRYGGRGITMCAWLKESVLNLIELIGNRPKDREILDRTDNDKGYWCGRSECADCGPAGRSMNVRWVTNKESANNTIGNIIEEWQGVKRTLAQWEDRTGIPARVIRFRLKAGWDRDRAFTAQVRKTSRTGSVAIRQFTEDKARNLLMNMGRAATVDELEKILNMVCKSPIGVDFFGEIDGCEVIATEVGVA